MADLQSLASSKLYGSCLCKAISYEVDFPPSEDKYTVVGQDGQFRYKAWHCHCDDCRQSSGALFGSFFWVPRSAFRFLSSSATPAIFRSSAEATRSFCPTCSTQLTYAEDANPDECEFTIATLGQADAKRGIEVTAHYWVGSRIDAGMAAMMDDGLKKWHTTWRTQREWQYGDVASLSTGFSGSPSRLQGKCHCGAVAFEIDLPMLDLPDDCTAGTPNEWTTWKRYKVTHCHCNLCRLSSGALFQSWLTCPTSALHFTSSNNSVRTYGSSSIAIRTFCFTCGTSFRMDCNAQPERTYIAVACLDKIKGRKWTLPVSHIYVGDALDGGLAKVINDGLPKYVKNNEDGAKEEWCP